MIQTASTVSVIVCSYTQRRWHDLLAALDSLRAQTYTADEIIVVIDHNPDLLGYAQEHLPGIVVIGNHAQKGLSGARNSGAMVAQGAVIAFMDDDAIADPQWIEYLIICYTDTHVAGVGGKIEPFWLEKRPTWFPDEFNWVVGCTYRGMPTENAPVRNVIGANMSVRRNILLNSGGFRESFGCDHTNNRQKAKSINWFRHHAGDEETEFCIRVALHSPGSIWLYTPYAPVRHRIPPQRTRLSYYLWRCYDEGLGKASLVELHGTQAGLASEQVYTLKVLPQGVVRGLIDALFHQDLSGLTRAGAIVAGLIATAIGYLIGIFFSVFILKYLNYRYSR